MNGDGAVWMSLVTNLIMQPELIMTGQAHHGLWPAPIFDENGEYLECDPHDDFPPILRR